MGSRVFMTITHQPCSTSTTLTVNGNMDGARPQLSSRVYMDRMRKEPREHTCGAQVQPNTVSGTLPWGLQETFWYKKMYRLTFTLHMTSCSGCSLTPTARRFLLSGLSSELPFSGGAASFFTSTISSPCSLIVLASFSGGVCKDILNGLKDPIGEVRPFKPAWIARPVRLAEWKPHASHASARLTRHAASADIDIM